MSPPAGAVVSAADAPRPQDPPPRTASIGLLLEDLGNPFSAALHRAVEDVARARGVAVLSASLDEDVEREHTLIEAFLARHVDGLVIAPAGDDQGHLERVRERGIPVVAVDRVPQHADLDAVVSDNQRGAASGVAHLVEQGHTRIAYLGDFIAIATARQRFAGYGDALAAAGLRLDPALVRHDLHSESQAMAATVGLLGTRHPPTALFTSQNLVTLGAIRALRRYGLNHRVALVGLDDIPLGDLLDPGVTVVAQDPGQMGRRAADLLFQRLQGDAAEPAVHVIRTRLIRRGSGEIPCETAEREDTAARRR